MRRTFGVASSAPTQQKLFPGNRTLAVVLSTLPRRWRMTDPSPRHPRLWRDTDGTIIVLVAVTISALIGLAGFGVGAGALISDQAPQPNRYRCCRAFRSLRNRKRQRLLCSRQPLLGSAAWHHAMPGATASPFYRSPAQTPHRPVPSPTTGQMCANNPPVLGPSAGDNNAVEVILAQQQNSFLGSLFLPSVTIGTRAVAKINVSGVACSLSLDPSASSAVKFNGTTNVDLTNCGIAANSNNPTSMVFTGNTTFQAAWAQTVGNYTAGGNTTIPIVQIDAFPVTDPYSCNPPQIGCAGQIKYVLPTTPQTFRVRYHSLASSGPASAACRMNSSGLAQLRGFTWAVNRSGGGVGYNKSGGTTPRTPEKSYSPLPRSASVARDSRIRAAKPRLSAMASAV